MGELADEGTLAQLPGVEDPAWLRVIELGSLCCLPMALKAAINLNIMDILNKEPHCMLSAAQIVSHLHIFPSSRPQAATSLDRILRVLACHGVLSSSLEQAHNLQPAVRTYGLNEVSKFFVKNEDGASLAPMVLMNQDKVFMETWHYLDEAVLDGTEPFTRAHGKDAFSYGQEDVGFDKLFNSAMANHTQLLIQLLLNSYASGFDNVSTLVDVGGGFGTCSRMIVSRHPHIKVINFDQPHVIAAAPAYPGVENIGGDMFFSIPRGDTIFMKWILHDWSDEHCLKILKNCYEALPEKSGKVIIVDALLPTAVESGARARVGYHLDVLMLAYNQGGKERTEIELLQLSKHAGFTNMQVVCKLNECTVVELYKIT